MIMSWQTIETAPKDGETIILSDGKYVVAGCWAPHIHGDRSPWAFVDNWEAWEIGGRQSRFVRLNGFKAGAITHWMPLPAPPTALQV